MIRAQKEKIVLMLVTPKVPTGTFMKCSGARGIHGNEDNVPRRTRLASFTGEKKDF